MFLVLVCFAGHARAQEMLVPIDQSGRIEVIDADLEKNLGLFPEYAGFQEARLYQVNDSVYVLEVTYSPKGRQLKTRLPLNRSEMLALRERVALAIEKQAPRLRMDQSGRTRLLIGTTLLSLGYYGWGVPASLEVHDGRTAWGLYMLISGAGFYLPYAWTREVPVSDGDATLALYGGTRGILHGIALNNLLVGNDSRAQEMIMMGIVGSVGEMYAGYRISRHWRLTPGSAEIIGVGGDFGLIWGLGAANLLGFMDGDGSRNTWGTMLLGAGGGYWLGSRLAAWDTYTRGDAHIVRTTALLGAFAATTAAEVADVNDDKVFTALVMAGSGIAFDVGHHLVRDHDFSEAQGNLVTLSGLAGGLLGFGVAYLISPPDSDNLNFYLVSTTIGATGGFTAMYRSLTRSPDRKTAFTGLHLDVMPEGLVTLAASGRSPGMRHLALPLIRLSYRR